MKNQPNKISPILLKFISYSIADIARFKGLVPQQLSDNLLVKLLFGVVESLHTLRAANGCFGFDVAEAVLAIKSHKSQACQVHKLCTAMLTSDSVSCSHSSYRFKVLHYFHDAKVCPHFDSLCQNKKKVRKFSHFFILYIFILSISRSSRLLARLPNVGNVQSQGRGELVYQP